MAVQSEIGAGGGVSPAAADPARARYTSITILLHWTIGALILFQLAAAFLYLGDFDAMTDAERALAFNVIQTHKAVGLTVLALSIARLAWRLSRPAPPIPAAMPGWQRAASGASHVLLYVLMIGLPVTGWAMVSASPTFGALPTSYFGLFDVPHLPVLETLAPEVKAWVSENFHVAHSALALSMVALLALHVGAALKHHIVDRDAVLARMAPFVSAPNGPLAAAPGWSGAGAALGAGLIVAAGVGVAALYAGRAAQVASAEMTAADLAPQTAAEAPVWSVDYAASRIAFAGDYGFGAFEGAFSEWTADIRFDPDNLSGSSITAVVSLASAATGDGQIDGSLASAEYFHTAEHPQAVFRSDAIEAGDAPGAYVARGSLTMKGVTAPFELPFTLDLHGTDASAEAALEFDRQAFGVGPAPGGEVGLQATIPLTIEIVAARSAP